MKSRKRVTLTKVIALAVPLWLLVLALSAAPARTSHERLRLELENEGLLSAGPEFVRAEGHKLVNLFSERCVLGPIVACMVFMTSPARTVRTGTLEPRTT
jgi:hypothetical protein